MTKEDLKFYLHQDAENAGIKPGALNYIMRLFVPSYCYLYITLLRKTTFYLKSKSIFGRLWGVLLYIRLHHLSAKLGFYIPKDVFGPGVYIPHFGSVVVNPNCKIGANCQINNNVVIGLANGGCPIIGDNVFIGSGAVICGNVHIANNVWIGANSVVKHDVLEESVLVAGSPAKIVAKKQVNWKGEKIL